jgi:proton glutamate symport protein
MGSRSSLASLPALLDAGRRLDLPSEVNSLVSPLAVAIFKANRTISGTIKYLFLARAFGIETDLPTTFAYVGTTLLASFSTPGIPSAGPVFSTPALLAAGIPMEGIALTYAVDSLPDVFKTLANITADLAAACIVAARLRRRPAQI